MAGNKHPSPKTLEKARANVAARHPQGYHKRAILAGDWDNGSLVRDELARLNAEQGAAKEKRGKGRKP